MGTAIHVIEHRILPGAVEHYRKDQAAVQVIVIFVFKGENPCFRHHVFAQVVLVVQQNLPYGPLLVTQHIAGFLPDAAEKEMDSTAAAASFVAESKDKSIAAVAAPGAAELYGLTVLAENVQITDTNRTRFYVLSKTKNPSGGKRAVFIANCEANRLDDIIIDLSGAGFELVTLHDRPDGTKLGAYNYVIEAEAKSISDDMISEITEHDGIRFVGCFDNIEKQ